MVAYRILGNNLVSDEEFYLKGLDRKLANAAENGHADRVVLDNGAELDFTGNAAQPLAATPADIRAQPVAEAPALPDIGFGKPLTVEILQAAAGDLGSSG